MVTMLKKCPLCGGKIEERCGPVETEIRNEIIVVDNVHHGMCLQCGETFFHGDAASDMHKRAVVQHKREQGLLSGAEVKAIREGLGMSQARFERMIGAGPKTVVRWENDSVFQNRTADTLLRVLRDYPQVAADLANKSLRS